MNDELNRAVRDMNHVRRNEPGFLRCSVYSYNPPVLAYMFCDHMNAIAFREKWSMPGVAVFPLEIKDLEPTVGYEYRSERTM